MIFPFLDADVSSEDKKVLPTLKEVAWDFKTNRPIIQHKEFLIVEGVEALKVWVYKAIKTNRFEFEIYTWDYGSEITELIGKGFTSSLIISEVERYVKEALLINEYIVAINSIKVSITDDILFIELALETIYGEVELSV